MSEQTSSPYLTRFRGGFKSAMRWHQLDALWERLRAQPQGWYVYHVGDDVPNQPVEPDRFEHFIAEVDQLLRTEHAEDYCGIVYADDLQAPTMVKIYDPHNLGVSCGYSENPPLPGWVLSQLPPQDLESQQVLTGSRKRWWRRLFA